MSIPADVVCVDCRNVTVKYVDLEYLRAEPPVDPYDLERSDFVSFEAVCPCAGEETWHNVTAVLRGRIDGKVGVVGDD